MLSELGAGHSEGVDGSNEMITKATSKDSNHKYSLGLLPDWSPGRRFDLVHTMEFLYYLDDPAGMISIIHNRGQWLKNRHSILESPTLTSLGPKQHVLFPFPHPCQLAPTERRRRQLLFSPWILLVGGRQ